MIEIRSTDAYDKWFKRLRDERAKSRINARIIRLAVGNAGDVKGVGGGVSELRIDYGPEYRIYFMRRGDVYILLLCGGDKSSQAEDIDEAKKLSQEIGSK